MAIAFRAMSQASRGGTSPLSVAPPTGTASGDLMVMIAAADNNQTPAASGWTSAGSTTWHSGTYRAILLWKIAGSSEPNASVTTGATSSLEVMIVGFSGVDNGTPFDVAAVWEAETSSSPVTVASVTTLTANAWWLVMAADDTGTSLTTGSKPTGWTQQAKNTAAAVAGFIADTVLVASAGTQSATSYTKSAGNVVSAGMALRESGASPGSAFTPQTIIIT